MKSYFLSCMFALSLTLPARADLVITEVMSTSGAPAGVLNGLDWWELTNNGNTSVSLAGYQWEDNAPTGFNGNTAIFPSVSIAAGESVVIHQGDNAAQPIEAAFRTAWNLAPSVQVLFQNQFTGANLFSGLNAGGDGVNLYNSAGTLIESKEFGASTAGQSFSWDAAGNSLGLSVSGQNGAFTASYGAFGSPGAAVPEPSAVALLGLSTFMLLRRKRS